MDEGVQFAEGPGIIIILFVEVVRPLLLMRRLVYKLARFPLLQLSTAIAAVVGRTPFIVA